MKPATIYDLDTEAGVLASAYEGFWPTRPVDPEDFYATLHRDVGHVLAAARAGGIQPTVRNILAGLDELGTRGAHLERAVRRIVEATPVAVRPDELASRVRALAWRRRMALRLDRLRALLLEAAISDREIETELDAFVELGAAMPTVAERT